MLIYISYSIATKIQLRCKTYIMQRMEIYVHDVEVNESCICTKNIYHKLHIKYFNIFTKDMHNAI